MVSTSSQGSTRITLQFSLTRDLDAAALDVQSAIAAAQRRLPAALPAPPTFRKVNPADAPVLLLALRSETLPLARVDEYAQNVLSPRLSTISGVAQVSVYGSQKRALRVRVDPVAMAARGLRVLALARCTWPEDRTTIKLDDMKRLTDAVRAKG